MNRLEQDIRLAVRSAAPVLLTGSMIGTRALAYRIHSSSGWRFGPFLIVDCESPHPSLEASLFKALFPGDTRPERDTLALQLAQPGTVLLHEIGRLSGSIQVRLADRLAEVAESSSRRRPCRRVIASTVNPLLPKVEEGSFDDRLYYRLNVIHLMVSPTA